MGKFKRWIMYRLKILLSRFYKNIIVCYGTSLTTDSGWVEELDKHLKDYKIIRFALGGINSNWGIDNLPKLLKFKPKIVLLEFAINDCRTENPFYRNVTEQESKGNMESIFAQLLAANIKPYLLLMSPPLDITCYGRNPYEVRKRFNEFNYYHSGIAKAFNIKVINVLNKWESLDRLSKIFYMPDGIHPTKRAGKEIIVPTILKELNPL